MRKQKEQSETLANQNRSLGTLETTTNRYHELIFQKV